jgi:hypothetical protein
VDRVTIHRGYPEAKADWDEIVALRGEKTIGGLAQQNKDLRAQVAPMKREESEEKKRLREWNAVLAQRVQALTLLVEALRLNERDGQQGRKPVSRSQGGRRDVGMTNTRELSVSVVGTRGWPGGGQEGQKAGQAGVRTAGCDKSTQGDRGGFPNQAKPDSVGS